MMNGHLSDLFVAIQTIIKCETLANKIMVCKIPKSTNLSVGSVKTPYKVIVYSREPILSYDVASESEITP